MGKLFGTDGVRGVAGEALSAELAVALGRAAAAEARADRPQVLIIRDTRESGPMLEAALAAGIAQGGGDALIGGVAPTPAASVLVRRLGLDLAAVVSASHNPWQDNGIKFFGRDGAKLSDASEERIESAVAEGSGPPGRVGAIRELYGALDDYQRELQGAFRFDLAGLRVVLDCANGATYRAAKPTFERLGAAVDAIGIDPDGRNINEGCGSTHPEALAEQVVTSGADLGFAYDGDGDRVIAVDATGSVRDGDELIALIATEMQASGALAGGVAVTVMSNYGFHSAMSAAGIDVATTPVGDRHVSFELARRGWSLGGEQSGHVIWTGFAPSGDGIAASLLVANALGGRPLADAIPMAKLPQTLVNVRVSDRDAVADAERLWAEVEREGEALEGRGRILVRPSGTQSLVRVMAEAPTQEECDAVAGRLVSVVKSELGAA
ncbi:MAG: phosphoglucosamine mutase [Actinomycetota bacterium]|nr:phosphoglucosamine mutase [Actinomycetota bacterium]